MGILSCERERLRLKLSVGKFGVGVCVTTVVPAARLIYPDPPPTTRDYHTLPGRPKSREGRRQLTVDGAVRRFSQSGSPSGESGASSSPSRLTQWPSASRREYGACL